jgi:hypothetical protein
VQRKFVGPGQEDAVIRILSTAHIDSSAYNIRKGEYGGCETIVEVTANEEALEKLEKALSPLGFS